MPYSSDENRSFVVDVVTNVIRPVAIIDIGAGSGTYADLLRPHYEGRIDGVEVWEPYVEQFRLREKYDTLYADDVRDMAMLDYGLVIFGDVLEHMTLEEAKEVWERTAEYAGWGMISVPIIHYPQGAEFGNPFEVHVQDHLSAEDVRREFGPFDYEQVYQVTATFFRKFR